MAVFTISEEVRRKALRSNWLMLVVGIIVAALAVWLLLGGNIYSVISGVLGVCLGFFIVYGAIKAISTVRQSQPKITIDDNGLQISGEKDKEANKLIFWSQVRSAKVVHLSTAPYLEIIEKNNEKITTGYRFDDFDAMIALVKTNLERFGIQLAEEIAQPPEG